ncbi:family 43 glycosylhydrolase [Saccharothrix sp.]|uniref:family 43 glycosylhydrolase n=1 Tax=Saccharothrix sp. TaxID=1873460 RepID=UPI002810DB2A|nr:family 43 glycosylhydrolase [Saccharothrix sp.]
MNRRTRVLALSSLLVASTLALPAAPASADATSTVVNGPAAPSPPGPWTKRGAVLQKRLDLGIKGTGHHSVVQAPGTDTRYVAYRRFAVPSGNGTNREVTIDRMVFNPDGTIAPIVPTL